jgi:hypothetical protein
MRETLAQQRPTTGPGAADRGSVGGLAPAATTAVVTATAAAEGGGPAALLAWEGATVLRRVLDQLAGLGIDDVHVITRPDWAAAVGDELGDHADRVELYASATTADDLRTIARVAAAGGQAPLVLAYGDMITHREALAGLLADPRVATGVLSTGGRAGRPYAFRIRSRRGRVISAGSAYHSVNRPTGSFLGVLKVAPGDRALAAAQAEELADLAADPPVQWGEELEGKTARWRHSLARTVLGAGDEAEGAPQGDAGPLAAPGEPLAPEVLDAVELPEDVHAELALRRRAAPEDAVALVLVGLVRGDVHVGNSYLRGLFWARPISPAVAGDAARRIADYDEDKVLLDAAVKASDGFFTTFFVSPYSRFIARWAARVGLTPNQVTVFSLALGVLSAAAFATGERWGLIAGAVLLQLAFTFDCVDGQLARYTRRFSKLGAWLDSIFDRTKEYVVFAGLAIGAARTGDSVWLLAGCALTLQTFRHMADFNYGIAQHQAISASGQPPLRQAWDGAGTPPLLAAARELAPQPVPVDLPPPPPLSHRARGLWRRLDRWPPTAWLKRIVAFPIGERFAAISITAALWSAHTTFVVLLAWGGFAALYSWTGRILRSVSR